MSSDDEVVLVDHTSGLASGLLGTSHGDGLDEDLMELMKVLIDEDDE